MPITITYTNQDINEYDSFDKIPNFDKKVYTTDNFFSNTMLQIIKKESPNYLVFSYTVYKNKLIHPLNIYLY